MEVLNTSNYSLGMGLKNILELDNVDLIIAMSVKSRNRSH